MRRSGGALTEITGMPANAARIALHGRGFPAILLGCAAGGDIELDRCTRATSLRSEASERLPPSMRREAFKRHYYGASEISVQQEVKYV
jgi:hypothetical protein